jgi:hypothetical protein
MKGITAGTICHRKILAVCVLTVEKEVKFRKLRLLRVLQLFFF